MGNVFHDPTSDIFRLLLMAIEDKLHQWLEMYLFVTYTACGLPMDGNFLEDMMRAYEQFLTRNAAFLYSGNPDITKEEDDEILAELKETMGIGGDLNENVEES